MRKAASPYGVIDEAFQYVHNADPAGNNLYQLAGGNLQDNHQALG